MRTITVWLFVFLAAVNAIAQESLRPDVAVALVGGQLLDGYEGAPIHHSVVEEAHKAGVNVHAHLYDPDAIRAAINALQHVDIVVKDGGAWYAESAAYGPVTEIGHAF